jgi:hypothetical protein
VVQQRAAGNLGAKCDLLRRGCTEPDFEDFIERGPDQALARRDASSLPTRRL